MHQDIVEELPLDWTNLAESEKCKSQFAIYKNRYLCLQGHPEFTRDMIQEILNVRKHLFSQEYKTILNNLNNLVNSDIIVRFIVEFINKSN